MNTIGVLYAVHGGFDEASPQHLFDSFVHIFSHDPNHFVYRNVIWNPAMWPLVLRQPVAQRDVVKYNFSYSRLVAADPYYDVVAEQLSSLQRDLERISEMHFVFDHIDYIAGDRIEHYPYPRFLFRGRDGVAGEGASLIYCGEGDEGGPWPLCDPDRYNVDGPVERLLRRGADAIVVVDTTVGGPRFSKTYDVLSMVLRVVEETSPGTPVVWANDPDRLLDRSYPVEPANWTRSLGPPVLDASVNVQDTTNPVVSDPLLATIHADAIAKSFSSTTDIAHTGVVFVDHGLLDGNRFFDPKVNDTHVLTESIKHELRARYPGLSADNVIAAWMGAKLVNPSNGKSELSREMRGENYGHAYLHEAERVLPDGEPRYWNALARLRDNGVRHIIVAFPQLLGDSVLNLVEVPNQIAKEIGKKNWIHWGSGQSDVYAPPGHPFAGHWGIWGATQCGDRDCCLTMGGCDDGRPYPPQRETSPDATLAEEDPSLVWDVCDYGHLGYDASNGPPSTEGPVQDQYTGTWTVSHTPNDDPRIGELLARHVVGAMELLGIQD